MGKFNLKRQVGFLGKTLVLLLIFQAGWNCRSFKVSQYTAKNNWNTNWNLFGGEPERSNFRETTVAPPLKKIWTYKASTAVSPTLVVVDGVLYFVTMDGRFEAVDVSTGKRIGKKNREGNYEATCAFKDGSLIIASRYGDKTLARYDLQAGKYIWKIDAGDIASEPLVVDDAIYISALYRHIDKYDFKSGERIWSFRSADQHRSSPALSRNVLVVGCDDGTLYAVNSETGTLKWQIKTEASIFATPVIHSETVFVGSVDSNFYAINLNDGSIQWTFNAKRPLYQTAATDGNDVFFGSSGGQFYALDAETGREKWRFKARSVISTAPVISGRVVYFGSLDKRYYCLNTENGQELWSQEVKGRIRTSPVVWKNYIFGASEDKFIYAFVQTDSVKSE